MKLILLRNKLRLGLSATGKTSVNTSGLPILKNVLIKTNGGRIMLCSTNLEMGVQYIIPGKVVEEGAVTVDSGTLSSLISALPTERIHLEREEKNLIVKTDNYHARIQGLSPDDFPLFPKIQEKSSTITFPPGVLSRIFQNVVCAAQYSDIRPEISGVLMNIQKGNVIFAATDSFRLAEQSVMGERFSLDNKNYEARVIIPIRTIQEVIRIADENEPMRVQLDENQILFSSETFQLISRQVSGAFPEYQQIIPQSVDTEVVVERAALIDGLKLAGIFTGTIHEITIRILENKKAIEISSEGVGVGTNTYALPAKISGNACEAVFNWKYLTDGLRVFESESIVFGLNGPDKPALITSPEHDGYFYIIMPIRS